MLSEEQAVSIEVLSLQQRPSDPRAAVLRVTAAGQYYIEETDVLVQLLPDSMVIIIHLDGDLQPIAQAAPAYNFVSASGCRVRIASQEGNLDAAILT
jgi:hypothetical protein